MAIHDMIRAARRVLPIVVVASLCACTESTPEFRRDVEIRTYGPPAQCVLDGGRAQMALESTPGNVMVPYSVKSATIECRNRYGWRGNASVELLEHRQAQVVVVHMHR